MIVSNFIHWWLTFLGSIAMIGIILIAIGIMLGIVKAADAMKHAGAILGILIVLMLTPSILITAWSGMSLWQQVALFAIAIGLLMLWQRAR
jgi:hypothetical protein